MNASIKILADNSDEIKRLVADATKKGLEEVGEKAVQYARQNIDRVPPPENSWYTRTGTLKRGIEYKVEDNNVTVGSNVDYAKFVEFGTGPYHDSSDGHTGRTDVPWKYYAEGDFHLSYGMEPFHFLKHAMDEHQDEYKKILLDNMKTVSKIRRGFSKLFSIFKR